MRNLTIILVACICLCSAAQFGVQGGLVSPDHLDMGFYVGGHVSFPDLFTNKLNLFIPVEVWMAGDDYHNYNHHHEINVNDISIAGQARYCFTGLVGPFAGGGLRINMINVNVRDEYDDSTVSHEWDDSETQLGLDLCGGYTFDTSSILITPELTFMLGTDYNTIKLGCNFSF